MKKLLTLSFVLALSAWGSVWAQVEDENAVYNQYGVKVDREELISEQRNNILTFESKNKEYRLWFDNRVQVDGAMFFGNNKDYNDIGNNILFSLLLFGI
jgi:phosphate-selective porin OprO/OprP